LKDCATQTGALCHEARPAGCPEDFHEQLCQGLAARERIKARLEHAVVEGAVSAARVRIDRFNFDPPVGFPVQFRVIGPDPQQVRQIAFRARDVVRQNPDTIDPSLDWNERMPSIRLEVDQDRACAVGLTPSDIAQSLQTLLSGVTATTMRDGTGAIDVVARAVPVERLSLDRIGDLTITARNGMAVPVAQVARVVWTSEEPILWRRNRDMAITVRADVRDGVQAPDVTNAIWPRLADIRASLPDGYRIEIGGAVEESAKANASLAALFPLMLIVMLTILMVQLQNFSRLVLVILTAPLAGAERLRAALGFVALLGLIALAGMIMRNTVILVDQIESDVASGQRPAYAAGRHCGDDDPPRPPCGPDGARRDPGDDPAEPQSFLGADGGDDHGRPVRRHLPDAAVPARPVRVVVPPQPARCAGAERRPPHRRAAGRIAGHPFVGQSSRR
jgi:multidrug efflux pump subunit AcrB